MSYNYAVTAYKPTAVTAVLTGHFTGEHELNLIIVKGNNLVVNVATPEGLKVVVDVNINGRISLVKLMRPKVSVCVRTTPGPNIVSRADPFPNSRRVRKRVGTRDY